MLERLSRKTPFQKVVLRRKSLRKKIRVLESTCNYYRPRRSARLQRYRAEYERLGFKMIELIPFSGQDLTGVTKYLGEHGETIDKETYLQIATDKYGPKGGVPGVTKGLQVTEDKSQKVEFYETEDGNIQMTVDGVDNGNPFPARFYTK